MADLMFDWLGFNIFVMLRSSEQEEVNSIIFPPLKYVSTILWVKSRQILHGKVFVIFYTLIKHFNFPNRSIYIKLCS